MESKLVKRLRHVVAGFLKLMCVSLPSFYLTLANIPIEMGRLTFDIGRLVLGRLFGRFLVMRKEYPKLSKMFIFFLTVPCLLFGFYIFFLILILIC